MNHIYIIEDDSVLCSELALALEAVGYHTTCANDFNNVLNEFLLVSPDLERYHKFLLSLSLVGIHRLTNSKLFL